jgi:hypothetical protein
VEKISLYSGKIRDLGSGVPRGDAQDARASPLGRSAKNVHPPWQNPSYAPGFGQQNVSHIDLGGDFLEPILSAIRI